jgi:RNA polymerase sigma factor (sigma-70 family)
MVTSGSVTRLIQQLRDEDPRVRDAAARLIWERYFRALLDLARRHLDRRVRRREDEEDVLQSMYKSFCLRQQRGDFDLAGRDSLWNLLVEITLCKARNVTQRHRSDKRDVARDQAGASAPEFDSGPSRWALEQMDAGTPTPEEAAVLNEALERRLQALPEPELREIALRKLEGYTNREIAALRTCTERTVERKLERIRSKWAEFDEGLSSA